MPHQTEIIGSPKELSDGQVAIAVRCCGDDKTISWLTLDSTLSPEAVEAAVDRHHRQVAAQHAGQQALKSHPAIQPGQKVQHP